MEQKIRHLATQFGEDDDEAFWVPELAAALESQDDRAINEAVLRFFFEEYDPSRLSEIDSLLNANRGREDALFAELGRAYQYQELVDDNDEEQQRLLPPANNGKGGGEAVANDTASDAKKKGNDNTTSHDDEDEDVMVKGPPRKAPPKSKSKTSSASATKTMTLSKNPKPHRPSFIVAGVGGRPVVEKEDEAALRERMSKAGASEVRYGTGG